jgi:hypothetical protein
MVWRKTNPLSDQFLQIGEIVRSVGEKKRDVTRVASGVHPTAEDNSTGLPVMTGSIPK